MMSNNQKSRRHSLGCGCGQCEVLSEWLWTSRWSALVGGKGCVGGFGLLDRIVQGGCGQLGGGRTESPIGKGLLILQLADGEQLARPRAVHIQRQARHRSQLRIAAAGSQHIVETPLVDGRRFLKRTSISSQLRWTYLLAQSWQDASDFERALAQDPRTRAETRALARSAIIKGDSGARSGATLQHALFTLRR